jgi:hypothetical protein
MYPGSRPHGEGSLYPASNLVYYYNDITWSRRRRSCVSNLSNPSCLSSIECNLIFDVPLGAPLPGFIYATRLGFTSFLVEYGLEFPFFVSKSIFESLYLSTSIIGRTRYTNPWVPEGRTHVNRGHYGYPGPTNDHLPERSLGDIWSIPEP